MGNRCCSVREHNAHHNSSEVASSLAEYLRHVPNRQQLQAYREQAAYQQAQRRSSRRGHRSSAVLDAAGAGRATTCTLRHHHEEHCFRKSAERNCCGVAIEHEAQNPLSASSPERSVQSLLLSESGSSAFKPLAIADYQQRLAQMRLEVL